MHNPHKRARLVVQVFVITTTERSKTETRESHKLKGKHCGKNIKINQENKVQICHKMGQEKTDSQGCFHFYISIPTQLYT